MTTDAGAVIQRLDDFTIAQIRAGEAIEHPAAVVKEAIENAIDAGATTIRVDIRAGGKREIRITDNGSGIPADQIELAFERHTTSKLRQAADLFSGYCHINSRRDHACVETRKRVAYCKLSHHLYAVG